MEDFEARLADAVAPESRKLLAAACIVQHHGETVYKNLSGFQSLGAGAPPLDIDHVVCMASAGKFITQVAALQLVDQGLATLDEPIFRLVPELEELEIISSDLNSSLGFTLRQRQQPITLRQMLTHSSGIGSAEHPLIEAWRSAAIPSKEYPADTDPIIRMLSTPLLFEPGQSWYYGNSVYWLQVVIQRASGEKFTDYVDKHVFQPLGMQSSAYRPRKDLDNRILQPVERLSDGSLAVAPGENFRGLICSISDVMKILSELVSPEPRILSRDGVQLFFEPAFDSDSGCLLALRANTEDYAAPAGIPSAMLTPPVNYSCGGLVVQGELPLSGLPRGTVTWNGMPNLAWALNREKGLALCFATQLLPVDDEITISLMMGFFQGLKRVLPGE